MQIESNNRLFRLIRFKSAILDPNAGPFGPDLEEKWKFLKFRTLGTLGSVEGLKPKILQKSKSAFPSYWVTTIGGVIMESRSGFFPLDKALVDDRSVFTSRIPVTKTGSEMCNSLLNSIQGFRIVGNPSRVVSTPGTFLVKCSPER